MTSGWAVLAAAVGLTVACSQNAFADPLPAESFLYQLRNVDLAAVAASPYKVVILDTTRDGTPGGAWTPQELTDLKAAGKIALAVISVGQADSSRAYWNPAWIDPETPELHPDWLGTEVNGQPGFYRVQYWKSAWQQILMGDPLAVVDQAVAQGFDGIVLDGVNAYQYWGPQGKLPSLSRNDDAVPDMVGLVATIADYVRALTGNPEFYVVPQNGGDLVASDAHLANISGIVAEATWFSGDKRQKTRITRTVVPQLDRVRNAGKPVFTLESLSFDKYIDIFFDRSESKGFVPLVSTPERDVLPALAKHPVGAPVLFAPESPPMNADAYPNQPPQFVWSNASQTGVTYRIRLSGSAAREQVYTFPKTGNFNGTSYTPLASEWRAILRLARNNGSGAVYWWVTTVNPDGSLRSSPASTLYRMHPSITTTIFWAGAQVDQTSSGWDRSASAWDSDWVSHFGGVDDPLMRSSDPSHPYWPAFPPLENPFYVALPYNDFTPSGSRRPNFADVIPWARFNSYGPTESAVKNRWVKITHDAATCYAQWEDVGPTQIYDFRYVFGTSKPRNKNDLNAGVEVSPALRLCLGIDTIGATNWRFVFDDETVPDGPWSEIVTTSQITP